MKTLYAIKLTKADILKIGEGAEPFRPIENGSLDMLYYLADSDDENSVEDIHQDVFYLYDDFRPSENEHVMLHAYADFPFGVVIEFIDQEAIKLEAVEMLWPADTFKIGQ